MLARLKFEISGLVKEILDQVDPSVFQSHDKTFLDPAMGGGQFIFETIKRLKEQGHSYDRIKTRVFGFESNIVYVNYVKERYLREFGEEIPATLRVGGLEELESLMKRFDLVMGNPPYNSGKGNGSHPIYRDFIIKGISLAREGGYVVMVSPPGFLNTSNAMEPSEVFSLLKGGDLKRVQLSGINEFFPGIGSPICYMIWCNQTYSGETVIDDDKFDISDFIFITRVFNKTIHSILMKLIQKENIHFNYRKSSDESKYRVSFKELNHISSREGNLSSKVDIPGEKSLGHFVKECESYEEAKNLHRYLSSKLVSFFNFITRYNSVLHNRIIGRISIPDLTRTWTDQELYAHFGLTDEEIRYIEEQVK